MGGEAHAAAIFRGENATASARWQMSFARKLEGDAPSAPIIFGRHAGRPSSGVSTGERGVPPRMEALPSGTGWSQDSAFTVPSPANPTKSEHSSRKPDQRQRARLGHERDRPERVKLARVPRISLVVAGQQDLA